MAAINANIVVDTTTLTLSPSTTSIGVIVEPINLNVTTSALVPAGNIGQLQYNLDGQRLGGVLGTEFANGNLTLGANANVKLTGGTNGYFLQTDGSGNLVWNAGTSTPGTGGTPGGAATQVQYNDGTSTFAGASGFTYDSVSADVAMGANLVVFANISSNISSANIGLFDSLNVTSSLRVTGTANLVTINNLKVPGGTSNQFIKTDGSGNLSFDTIPSGVAGSDTQIQYNDNGTLAGDANLTFDQITETLSTKNIVADDLTSTTSNLGLASNVTITGGTNGYYLQTDGAGSLTWAAGATPTGSGTPSGANTLIQLSDGSGSFDSGPGFSFDKASNLLSVPGGATISGDLITTGTTTVQQTKEKIQQNNTGSTGTVNFDILDGAILLKTSNATANFTINFRGNTSSTLASTLNTNESITCTYINKNGSAPKYANIIQIDGTTITPNWVGGAPTSGDVGYDSYTFNIIKTTGFSYTVLASKIGHS